MIEIIVTTGKSLVGDINFGEQREQGLLLYLKSFSLYIISVPHLFPIFCMLIANLFPICSQEFRGLFPMFPKCSPNVPQYFTAKLRVVFPCSHVPQKKTRGLSKTIFLSSNAISCNK